MSKSAADKNYDPKQKIIPSERVQLTRSTKQNKVYLDSTLIPDEKFNLASDVSENLKDQNSNVPDSKENLSDSESEENINNQFQTPENTIEIHESPTPSPPPSEPSDPEHSDPEPSDNEPSDNEPSDNEPSDNEPSDHDPSGTESDSSAMSSESSLKNIEKLGDDNWRSWAMRMTSHLTLKNLWVDPAVAFATQTPENQTISKKAYHHIRLAVDNANLELISSTDDSIGAWKILSDHHAKPTIVNKVALIRSIVNQKLTPDVTMQQHIVKMKRNFNELKQMGDGLSDGLSVAMLLTSLSDEYESLVTGFQSWDDSNLTMSNVGSALIDAWNRKRATFNESNKSLSLIAKKKFAFIRLRTQPIKLEN